MSQSGRDVGVPHGGFLSQEPPLISWHRRVYRSIFIDLGRELCRGASQLSQHGRRSLCRRDIGRAAPCTDDLTPFQVACFQIARDVIHSGRCGGSAKEASTKVHLCVGLPGFMVSKVSSVRRRQIQSSTGHCRFSLHTQSDSDGVLAKLPSAIGVLFTARGGRQGVRRFRGTGQGSRMGNSRKARESRGNARIPKRRGPGTPSPNLARRSSSGRSKPADSALVHCAAIGRKKIREGEMFARSRFLFYHHMR